MFRITFLLLFAAIAVCRGQSPRVLAWDDAIAARKLALVSGGSVVAITGMHPLKRTPPISLKGAAPYLIRALDVQPGPDGKPADRGFVIPESVKTPLLVILPDTTNPAGVRVLVIDDSPAGFKWGSYRFINATPKELVVQMERKAIRVPAGWKPVDLDLGGETRGVGARIALAEAIETPLYSAVWEYDTDVRTLCFIVPGENPEQSPVAFKAVPEDKLTLQLDSAPSRRSQPADSGKQP